jgi:hypothetical protein
MVHRAATLSMGSAAHCLSNAVNRAWPRNFDTLS